MSRVTRPQDSLANGEELAEGDAEKSHVIKNYVATAQNAATIPPTVAVELAPQGYPPSGFGDDHASAAEERLKRGIESLTNAKSATADRTPGGRKTWRREDTPYNVVKLNPGVPPGCVNVHGHLPGGRVKDFTIHVNVSVDHSTTDPGG